MPAQILAACISSIRMTAGPLYRMASPKMLAGTRNSQLIRELQFTESRHNWGADALALDPQNADVVYAALGMYTNSWYVRYLAFDRKY